MLSTAKTPHQTPAATSAAPAQDSFQSRPFAEQPLQAEHAAPDIAIQLATAQQFGHHFGNISVLPPTQPVIQRETGDEEVAEIEADTQSDNHSGLPDPLKAGLESMSGLPLDDVNVHYNSPEPAQFQALAHTQGTDIHLGPGQEEHLPHEAWHVVQQKQGRVQPTMQANGAAINDDPGLEQEADTFGARVPDWRPKIPANPEAVTEHPGSPASDGGVMQLQKWEKEESKEGFYKWDTLMEDVRNIEDLITWYYDSTTKLFFHSDLMSNTNFSEHLSAEQWSHRGYPVILNKMAPLAPGWTNWVPPRLSSASSSYSSYSDTEYSDTSSASSSLDEEKDEEKVSSQPQQQVLEGINRKSSPKIVEQYAILLKSNTFKQEIHNVLTKSQPLKLTSKDQPGVARYYHDNHEIEVDLQVNDNGKNRKKTPDEIRAILLFELHNAMKRSQFQKLKEPGKYDEDNPEDPFKAAAYALAIEWEEWLNTANTVIRGQQIANETEEDKFETYEAFYSTSAEKSWHSFWNYLEHTVRAGHTSGYDRNATKSTADAKYKWRGWGILGECSSSNLFQIDDQEITSKKLQDRDNPFTWDKMSQMKPTFEEHHMYD